MSNNEQRFDAWFADRIWGNEDFKTCLRLAWNAALAQQVPADGEWVPETELLALVAGPFMYHHKMNELQEREAKGFDRCRELTIQNIQTWCAMRRAMLAATPQAPQPVVDEWQYRPCRTLTGEPIPVEQRGSWSRDTHDAHKTPSESPAWEFRALYAASQPQQGAVAWVDPRDWELFVNIDQDRPHAARKVMLARRQTKLRTLPLYTTIGQQAVDDAAHEALTLLEQATYHDGRYGQMERIGWQESAQKLLPRLRAALAAHGKGGSDET